MFPRGHASIAHIQAGGTTKGSCEQHRGDPERALRRIGSLEADRRRVVRSLDRSARGSDLHAEYTRQLAEIDEQLTHWRGVVARAEAEGFKVWSRHDFQRGDFVQYLGTWYEVLRVNAKSLTVPHVLSSSGRTVVRRTEGQPGSVTWTVGYHDGITGRMSAQEMVEAEAETGGA